MAEPEPQPAAAPPLRDASAELREKAQGAWSFGIAAVGLAMVAPCGSYVTLLGALPLGFIAMRRAKELLEGPTPLDETTEVLARHARLTGLMAALWSTALLALVVAVILLYAGLIAMVFAITPPGPPPATP